MPKALFYAPVYGNYNMLMENKGAVRVKDTSFKGLWKVVLTLKEF